jgi:hypothetical protein
MIVLAYVHNLIIVGECMEEVDQFTISMQNSSENFVLMDKGDIDKFLGIEIKYLRMHEFEISQPFLVNQIISFTGIQPNGTDADCRDKLPPAAAHILDKDLQVKPRKKTWKYQTAVGMISYLQEHMCPHISMPIHQTVRFCNNPKLSHEQAITRIKKCFLGTRDKGICYKIDLLKGLECFVDADFAGGWDINNPDNAGNLMSTEEFVIKYVNCPIYWSSKLQTEIAFSAPKAEYITLSFP